MNGKRNLVCPALTEPQAAKLGPAASSGDVFPTQVRRLQAGTFIGYWTELWSGLSASTNFRRQGKMTKYPNTQPAICIEP